MKNNLLKSVATVATASALLFSTVTSFAATATTVTTYEGQNKVRVTSTITGANAGKMITYLASYKTYGTIDTRADIAYINQQTVPESGNVTFSYDITKSGMTAGDVVAKVKYGSDDAVMATDLNKDASSTVQYGALTVSAYGCTATPDKEFVGNGEKTTVTVAPENGYEVKLVSINGAELTAPVAATYEVPYADNMEFVVVCGAAKSGNSSVKKVRDYTADENGTNKIGVICSGYAAAEDVKFGVYAYDASRNTYNDGFYEAQVDNDGFYAVEFEKVEGGEDLPAKLVPAYKTADGDVYGTDGSPIN